MVMIAVIGLLLGAGLGTRSNIFEFIIATLFVSGLCLLIGIASGDAFWALAGAIVVLVISLQAGYVGALSVRAGMASHNHPDHGPATASDVGARWKRYRSSRI